jgi:hypothetical protein
MNAGPARRRRRGVAAVAALIAVAALMSLLAGFSPSLSPPELHPRELGVGAARNEILIDTQGSLLSDAAPASRYDTEKAAQVARVYVTYLESDGIAATLGRAVGLRGQSVTVSGPFTLLLNRTNFAAPPPSLPDPRRVDGAYRVLLDIDGRNPVLTIYTQAPSRRSAIALADSTRSLLLSRVAAMRASNPGRAGSAVVLRALGPTVGGQVGRSARWQLMALVFVLVLALGASLLSARRLRLARRRSDSQAMQRLDRLDDVTAGADEWPHTTRLLPWALAGFIAMLFLVPFDAIKLPLQLPLDSNLDRPLLVALLMLWISSLAVISGAARPRVKLTRVHGAALAFFAVCCLSLAFNGHSLTDMSEVTLVVKKLALLLSFIVFFFIAASVLRPREVSRFIALLVGLGVLVAIGTVIEYRYQYNPFYALWGKLFSVQSPSALDTHDSIGRLTVYGPTSQPLELAAMLAMVIPFALIGSIDSTGWGKRLMYMVAVALLIAGGLATSRKTSLIAPAAAMLLLTAYRPRDVLRVLLGLGLVLGVLVHFTSPGAIGNVLTQFEPGKFGSALTTTDRAARYDAVRPDVVSHMLIGRGYESYDPHKYRILDNEYLGLLIGIGGIGLIGYLAIFGAMMSAAHRTIRGPDPRRASPALAALASVGVIAIASALFDVLSFPHVPYLLFFVAAMIVALREPSPVPEPARRTAPRPQPLYPPSAGLEPFPFEPVPPPSPGAAREPVLTG